MSPLTSRQALELTASFAFTADRMRATDAAFHTRAKVCEAASRVAFLRAYLIAKNEELQPGLGDILRRAVFAVA